MSRIFIEDSQIEELESMDIFDSLDDVFDDEWDKITESEKSDWFGVDDPLI